MGFSHGNKPSSELTGYPVDGNQKKYAMFHQAFLLKSRRFFPVFQDLAGIAKTVRAKMQVGACLQKDMVVSIAMGVPQQLDSLQGKLPSRNG